MGSLRDLHGAEARQRLLNHELLLSAGRGRLDEVQTLLNKGADVTARGSGDITALMDAAHNGHLEVVKLLLDKGADINAIDEREESALMHAALQGHSEVARLLQGRGAEEILIAAACLSDMEAVQRLVKRSPYRDHYRWTALMWAARHGREEVVRFLLDEGAGINDHGEDGWTALMCAAFGGHLETTKMLLDVGADTKARNEDGDTALMIAQDNGFEEIAKVLQKAGARE